MPQNIKRDLTKKHRRESTNMWVINSKHAGFNQQIMISITVYYPKKMEILSNQNAWYPNGQQWYIANICGDRHLRMSTQHWGTFVMVYQSTSVCGVGDDFVLIYPLVIMACWTIHHLYIIFPSKYLFRVDFPLPHMISGGYVELCLTFGDSRRSYHYFGIWHLN